MTDDITAMRDLELWTPAQLAKLAKVPIQTLANWRVEKRGPAYIKIGRLVRYPAATARIWLAGGQANDNSATSEAA